MTTLKTWLASAALLGGAGGGAAIGLAATGPDPQPAAAPTPVAAAPDATQLQQQIDALLQQDHALKHAVSRARARLAVQVRTGERSLAALHRRIVTAQAELARAQVAPVQTPTVTVAATPATTAPAPHATTGASGAGGSGESEHEGGGDD